MASVNYKLTDEESQVFMKLVPFGTGKPAANACDKEVKACVFFQRRAWDSNPQPLSGHLISSQAAGQFAYPPGVVQFNLRCQWRFGKVSPPRSGGSGICENSERLVRDMWNSHTFPLQVRTSGRNPTGRCPPDTT